jgi:hypothetical protein
MDTLTVWIELDGFAHHGAVPYDDDRDTVPDRSEESIGLGAFEFSITYDPAVVDIVGVDEGPGVAGAGRSFQCLPADEDVGVYSFGCVSLGRAPDGPQGTITLGAVRLNTIGSGTSPLVLEASVSGPLGDPASVGVKSAVVRVPKGASEPPVGGNGNLPDGSLTSGSLNNAGGEDDPADGGVDPVQQGEVVPLDGTVSDDPLAAGADGQDTLTQGRAIAEARNRTGSEELGVNEAAEGGGGSTGRGDERVVVAIGVATVLGALGLGAVLWQRRRV